MTPHILETLAPKQMKLPALNKAYNCTSSRQALDFSSPNAEINTNNQISSVKQYLELGRAQKALTFKLA